MRAALDRALLYVVVAAVSVATRAAEPATGVVAPDSHGAIESGAARRLSPEEELEHHRRWEEKRARAEAERLRAEAAEAARREAIAREKEAARREHSVTSDQADECFGRVRPLARISRRALVDQTWFDVGGHTYWMPTETVNKSTGGFESGVVYVGAFRDYDDDSSIAMLGFGRYHLALGKRTLEGRPLRLPFKCFPSCAEVEIRTFQDVFDRCQPHSGTLTRFAHKEIRPVKVTFLRCSGGGSEGPRDFIGADAALRALELIADANK